MLHDPSHVPVIPVSEDVTVSHHEREILRRLGEEIARIAASPLQQQKKKLWQDLNDLKSQRPMVWINEVPWHEMDVDGQLQLRCTGPWAQQLEDWMRKLIYQWQHMPGDMVVNPYIPCPKIYYSSDFGIVEQVDRAYTDRNNAIYSRQFHRQICDPADIEKIRMPKITSYPQMTQQALELMSDIFAGIIPVKVVGQSHIWFTPWDYLIRWWGVEEAMIDLVMRPEMVHSAYRRMVDGWMTELDQFEQQGLLELDCDNTRIGSGGYGYVSQLPGTPLDPQQIRAHNMWGCSNAQIFSSVSPEMHWEFALEHDLRWLQRWGLTYYGCCEPLDHKIHLLRRIPNLRKISVSPWCNTAKIVQDIGQDYVMSRKPSPAVFLEGDCIGQAEKQLRDFLEQAKGCHVEIILKDISTVGYQPQKLWQWEKMAMGVVEEYGG